jgi:Cu/Ag efflux pump CusA
MTPVKASLKYPVVTLVLTFMAVAVGVHAFLTMPRTEDPSITVRAWLVLAAYPGATSEQVEEQVTKTLEEHIFKFPEVRKQKTFFGLIRSESGGKLLTPTSDCTPRGKSARRGASRCGRISGCYV